ncbi:MAG: hypothetical protein Q7J16_06325 [Candidatus Cloacimonadales bacterium]|nr:hypothetical protein [Candidatus Cloacimonadales bacterium]
MKKKLIQIYQTLLTHFGHQNWWPAETKDEIIIGAILTQSISWQNVETAIQNLKRENLCSLEAIYHAKIETIAPLIRSTLYYNQKAKKLKNFTDILFAEFGGKLTKMFSLELKELRDKLLNIAGIGEETADSILLYVGEKPIFVVDAYTKRIFTRFGLIENDLDYQKVQDFFMENLPSDVALFQDFHAQIVRLGKEYCRKRNLKCGECPVNLNCIYSPSERSIPL